MERLGLPDRGSRTRNGVVLSRAVGRYRAGRQLEWLGYLPGIDLGKPLLVMVDEGDSGSIEASGRTKSSMFPGTLK